MSRILKLDIDNVYVDSGPDYIRDLGIKVELTDNGVYVYLVENGDEILDSNWKYYSEFGIKNIEFEE